jgi:hypothetical protein
MAGLTLTAFFGGELVATTAVPAFMGGLGVLANRRDDTGDCRYLETGFMPASP